MLGLFGQDVKDDKTFLFSEDMIGDLEKFSEIAVKIALSIIKSKTPFEAIDLLSKYLNTPKEIIHAGFILGIYTVMDISMEVDRMGDVYKLSVELPIMSRFIDWYLDFRYLTFNIVKKGLDRWKSEEKVLEEIPKRLLEEDLKKMKMD